MSRLPRIYKVGKFWFCGRRACVGIGMGRSPVAAYLDWRWST